MPKEAPDNIERLINVTGDPGIKDAFGFPMTRENAHRKSFEKGVAFYSSERSSIVRDSRFSSTKPLIVLSI